MPPAVLARPRRALWLVLPALLLPALGCGDYEGRMYDAQKRLERIDEENHYVEEMLDLMKLENGKATPATDVFLRAPVGIRRTPEEATWGILYRYVKQQGKDGPYKEVDAVVVPADQKDFENTVLQTVADLLPAARPQPYTRSAREREPFEVRKCGGDSGYVLFFCKSSSVQVAVGYLPETGKSNPKSVQFSIDSLAVGPDVGKLRADCQRYLDLKRSGRR